MTLLVSHEINLVSLSIFKKRNKQKWSRKEQMETINKMKRQPTELEKIFANDISDKGVNI